MKRYRGGLRTGSYRVDISRWLRSRAAFASLHLRQQGGERGGHVHGLRLCRSRPCGGLRGVNLGVRFMQRTIRAPLGGAGCGLAALMPPLLARCMYTDGARELACPAAAVGFWENVNALCDTKRRTLGTTIGAVGGASVERERLCPTGLGLALGTSPAFGLKTPVTGRCGDVGA